MTQDELTEFNELWESLEVKGLSEPFLARALTVQRMHGISRELMLIRYVHELFDAQQERFEQDLVAARRRALPNV
jgi:hypothetical protein